MAKQKIRELISRATYKTIKSMNREEVNEFAKRIYLDALKDAAAGYKDYDRMHDLSI